MKLTPQQLKQIATDPVIQERIANDQELNRLMDSRRTEQAEENLETLLVLGGDVSIAGMTFPPPVAALFSFLEIINSSLVAAKNTPVSRNDLERCLYIMKHREQAVSDLVAVVRYQAVLDRIEDKVMNDPDALMVYLEHQERQASAWQAFDSKVAAFAVSLGIYNIAKAVDDVEYYLSVAGGFDMLPELKTDKDKKKDETAPSGTLTG